MLPESGLQKTLYDHAFRFWQRLSETQADLSGGRALANLSAPFLLANAAWYPQPGSLQSVAEWYTECGLPPALVAPMLKDSDLERTLKEGPFMRERRFGFRKLEPAPEADDETVVEQVSWAQGRTLGDLLAARYEMLQYGVAVGAALTRAMQKSEGITGYVAYRDEAVGAMVSLEGDGVLAAMVLVDRENTLSARLVAEAEGRGLAPYVLELESESETEGVMGLERWSIR